MPPSSPSTKLISQWTADLQKALESAADGERAKYDQGYLKSELRFLGTRMPHIRATAKDFCAEHKQLKAADAFALAQSCFHTPIYELRAVSIGILERKKRLLREEHLRPLHDVLVQCQMWSLVDWLAISVLGSLLPKSEAVWEHLRGYSQHEDMWLRRTSLIAGRNHFRKHPLAIDYFEEFAKPNLSHSDFFIRKAIGWMLREISKHHPERCVAFVNAHRSSLSPLSRREAIRRLPEEFSSQLIEI